jgi:hypothetical protein
VKYPLIFLRFFKKLLDKAAKKCCRTLIIRLFYGGVDMSFTITEIRENLFSVFSSLLERREEFLNNPASDFTRRKKISFEQTMLFPMIAGADNVATELLNMFGEEDLPLPSAMIQRRNQIKKEAFQEMFYLFNKSIPKEKNYKGYQIVACDGSRLNLPYNSQDSYSLVDNVEGRKGFNQVHLNALYDILNDLFLDAEIQGMQEMNERDAFCKFLDKHSKSRLKRIFIADRGYATFNIYAHAINNNQLFLIRIKENDVYALCRNDKHLVENPRFDGDFITNIGRIRHGKNCKYENYHFIRKGYRYDYIEYGEDKVDLLRLRVVKFPLSTGSFEYIVTNLPRESFSIDSIKELYNLRWGEETAFRHLKYAGNMVRIHSIKLDFLIQEIYGKLTLYNFSTCIANSIAKRESASTNYEYNFNHTQIQKFVRLYIIGLVKDLEKLANKFLVPVRPGRKFKRIIRRQSAVPLSYR